ncbi:MAG: tRNA pseudouridine(38-40) synthase TruA [Paludibacteraceae bacterium]|jgi:tRNA pseudouridine38-40 synthase|nr:tRNA pseudouridine(38-40) synthase TruA [Paludibacteraceae bacterium]
MRYFIKFSYLGTEFHGSQRQPNGITVQETMELALKMLFREEVPLTFAGRTDAGVHAREMYAHFDLADSKLPIANNLVFRLNGILPNSIAIYDIVPVTDEAHARFTAKSRTYEYHIVDHKDPFIHDLATRVRPGLDFDAMNKAAKYLIGKQDFASFCRSNTDVKTTICDLTYAHWEIKENGHAVFTITADRFLRNMVRAVVGTLFEVGRGKITIEQFAEIITQHTRTAAGDSAPAEGLYLTKIVYPEEIWV